MRLIKGRGIYRIRNVLSGCAYVGATTRGFLERWWQHKYDLKNNKHRSRQLQADWNQGGVDNFVFEILEQIDDMTLLSEREQYWIDLQIQTGCYNTTLQVCPYRQPVLPPNTRRYDVTLVAPNGTIYERIYNLKAFCRIHKLNYTAMVYLCNRGRIKRHRGWSLIETTGTRLESISRQSRIAMQDLEYKRRALSHLHTPEVLARRIKTSIRKRYTFVDSDGNIHRDVLNLKAFCAERGLAYTAMIEVFNARRNLHSHKGWTRLGDNEHRARLKLPPTLY